MITTEIQSLYTPGIWLAFAFLQTGRALEAILSSGRTGYAGTLKSMFGFRNLNLTSSVLCQVKNYVGWILDPREPHGSFFSEQLHHA